MARRTDVDDVVASGVRGVSDAIDPEVYEHIPSVLTARKLEAIRDAFCAMVNRAREEDQAKGLCVCANCFGDRWGGVKRYESVYPGIRRRCLEQPRLLTDLGDGSRRI